MTWNDPDYSAMAEYQGKRWVKARDERTVERVLAVVALVLWLAAMVIHHTDKAVR